MAYNRIVRRVAIKSYEKEEYGYERGAYVTGPKGANRLLTNELWEEVVEALQDIREFGCSQHAHKIAKGILVKIGEEDVK